MDVKDGFKFGLGLWLATWLMGLVWVAIAALVAASFF